jgi:FAD/FMN-containing dehydrogenase
MSTTESHMLTGRVVRPGDAEYASASAGFNLRFAHTPSVVVFAQETGDVVNALAWARRNGLPVRARSGRHALEGWNAVDDGVVIDVSELKSATIDAAAQTATVGAGLNQLEAVTTLGAHGFAAPTGTEGSVGLVGATLGGGFGLLTRNYGMASDNLLAAEVVVATADGGAEAVIADEQNNADLLWALRGAGNGNFGIVTSLTYRIHPLTQAIYVVATWRGLDDLPRVFDAWQRSAPYADNRLTSQLEISREEATLKGLLASGTEAEACQLLEPILSVGSPDVVVKDASWPDIYTGFQIPIDEEPANSKFVSGFISEPFPPEAISVISAFMSTAPTAHCDYMTNAFGGAVSDSEPVGGSAFAHRDALFYAEPGASWGNRGETPPSDDALTKKCLEWSAEFGKALQPFVNGAYVNVPNAGMPDWEAAYWGSNVERLRTVKAKYDPDNVFSFEQGIQASTRR